MKQLTLCDLGAHALVKTRGGQVYCICCCKAFKPAEKAPSPAPDVSPDPGQ
jgi:hypothetical protein